MVRTTLCVVMAVLTMASAAEGAVPPPSSGGEYIVRIGADRTGSSIGEPWESVRAGGDRLRVGTNGLGAYYVIGNTNLDPQFGDHAGWTLTIPAGVRLTTFSIDASNEGWLGRRWTSGLRYTITATDAGGTALGAPLLECQPTPSANDCPGAFRSNESQLFRAPTGTRRIELRVECVLLEGCSRTANPDHAPGGNEVAAVEGGTFTLVDDTSPTLTSGSGDLWTDATRWFHKSDSAVAGMGAADNSGTSRLQWYVDGSLAYDTSGATTSGPLSCDYAFFRPCGDTSAGFTLKRSLFAIVDGVHELAVVALDAGGNVSQSLKRQIRIDDGPPPKVAVSVREGSALRDPGPWHLDFTVPPELDGSPVESAWYRFCAASNPGDCAAATSTSEGIDGLEPGDDASVAVAPPSHGEWTVRLWLGDRAGNRSEANASDPALIRYGQSAPVADPANPPTLSGDFTDGNQVRVSASGFDVAGSVSYSFQWRRCDGQGNGCADIAGATEQDYVLVHADAGHALRAKVTASNAKGSDSATTAASPPVAFLPPASGSATLSGTMRAGEELKVEDVAFEGTPPFELAYAWLRCSSGACDPIAGAAGASYVLGDEDIGQTIRATVTATNVAGSSSVDAARRGGAAGEVEPAPPRSTSAPDAPHGDLRVGGTATASAGAWAGSQPMTFSYVWQRCASSTGGCTAIAGATDRSYTLGTADLGKLIRVLVTARNGGDPVGPVASARTTPIEPAVDEDTGGSEPEPPRVDPAPQPAQPSRDADAPAPASPAAPAEPSPAVPTTPAVPASPALPTDLSKIPGNLVGAATCKVARVTPKRRSSKLRGIGRVTFAAAVPPRVTVADPLVLSLRVPRGRVLRVTYRAGKRTVGRSRKAPFTAAVRPKGLRAGGTQQLEARLTPRRGAVRRLRMKLNVAVCPSLLTAGVRFSGARAITQLRVFSRTSILGGTVTLPARLMPKTVSAGKRAGTLTMTGAAGRPAAVPLVAGRNGGLLARAGVKVRRSGRNVVFSGIPAGTGIVQIDLFGPRNPALRLLRGPKPLRFSARVRADRVPRQRLLATIKPSGRGRARRR